MSEPTTDIEPTNGEKTSARPKRRWRKRIIVLCVVLAVLAVLGAMAYAGQQMLLGPSEGTIVNNDLTEAAPAKPAVEWEQFEGTLLTFAYPNTYTIQPPNKDDPTALETHSFVASGMMNKILTVVVTKLPTGKLEDNSSYYMRSLHPDVYTMKPQTIQGEKVVVALSTRDSQEAAFWAHQTKDGGKLLTFALSGASINSPDTAAEYQKMLESVRWR